MPKKQSNLENGHLIIEKISSNIKSDINSTTLVVEPRRSNIIIDDDDEPDPDPVDQLLNIDYWAGNADFIGITKLEWDNYPIYVNFGHTYEQSLGKIVPWFDFSRVVTQTNYSAYQAMPSPQGDWVELYMTIQNTNSSVYYRVVYSESDFRGRNCTDMPNTTYDGANCWLGVNPPSGTTAFFYPNAQGMFYYTPVNGNQCPLSGSFFDGSNCFIADIPSTCIGFIYDNKWYVETDKIL